MELLQPCRHGWPNSSPTRRASWRLPQKQQSLTAEAVFDKKYHRRRRPVTFDYIPGFTEAKPSSWKGSLTEGTVRRSSKDTLAPVYKPPGRPGFLFSATLCSLLTLKTFLYNPNTKKLCFQLKVYVIRTIISWKKA